MDNKFEFLKAIFGDEFGQAVNLVQVAQPEIQELVNMVVENFGPILKKLVLDGALGLADVKVEVIEFFESKNFTREEAILLARDIGRGHERAIKVNKQ